MPSQLLLETVAMLEQRILIPREYPAHNEVPMRLPIGFASVNV